YAHLGGTTHSPHTGFMSAESPPTGAPLPPPPPPPRHAAKGGGGGGGATLTQASGEITDMAEYRERLRSLRSKDQQSRTVCNVLEATAAVDSGFPPEEPAPEISHHPARQALLDVNGRMQPFSEMEQQNTGDP